MKKKYLLMLSLMLSVAFAEEKHTKYTLDKAHLEVGFSVSHLGISSVKGRFKNVSGEFSFNSEKKEVKDLKVDIQAASIDTNQEDRDKHLKGDDFFQVDKYPSLTFVSSKATVVAKDTPVKLEGELTLHGVKKAVVLEVVYKGEQKDPWGNDHLAFSATTKLNRKDFGLNWNKTLDKGGLVVGEEITISIEGESLLEKPEAKKQASLEPALVKKSCSCQQKK